MEGVGIENFLCLRPESLPSQAAWLGADEGTGKGQSVSEPTLNTVFLLGGMSQEDLIYYSLPS